MVGAKAVKDLNHLFCQKIIEMQWHLKWQYVLLDHRASPDNLFLLVHTKDEFLSHVEKYDGFCNKFCSFDSISHCLGYLILLILIL